MRSGSGWKIAALLALLLLLLIFVPPLVNENRLERRIAVSMSQSLGRSVRLDGVSFHVLPLPGFTLSNLVVSEDPAFGYEPVIRADSVEATLRIASLYRRQVEFSTVRFIQPSLNLVRNPAGRWNLEDILMQASRAQTAPTGQVKAGPAPRFPYIEATGARVNLKLGSEKLPFSLADADFALWLNTPEMWNVRLKATPIRTDNGVQNTGLLRVEGSLGRGHSAAEVPLNLEARWNEAPLGQASELITASDSGWRGVLNATAKITGILGDAKVETQLHLRDVRRDAFVPAQMMDADLLCTAGGQLTHLILSQVHCSLPVEDAAPIEVKADTLDLQKPREGSADATLKAVPLHWLMGWGGVLSKRIDPKLARHGTVDGQVHWQGPSFMRRLHWPDDPYGDWSGELQMSLPPLPGVPAGAATPVPAEEKTPPTILTWRVDMGQPSISSWNPGHVSKGLRPVLHLVPATLKTTADGSLTLNAEISEAGYLVLANGAITPNQIALATRLLPTVGDNLQSLGPPDAPPDTPLHLNAGCERPWEQPQVCRSYGSASVPRH